MTSPRALRHRGRRGRAGCREASRGEGTTPAARRRRRSVAPWPSSTPGLCWPSAWLFSMACAVGDHPCIAISSHQYRCQPPPLVTAHPPQALVDGLRLLELLPRHLAAGNALGTWGSQLARGAEGMGAGWRREGRGGAGRQGREQGAEAWRHDGGEGGACLAASCAPTHPSPTRRNQPTRNPPTQNPPARSIRCSTEAWPAESVSRTDSSACEREEWALREVAAVARFLLPSAGRQTGRQAGGREVGWGRECRTDASPDMQGRAGEHTPSLLPGVLLQPHWSTHHHHHPAWQQHPHASTTTAHRHPPARPGSTTTNHPHPHPAPPPTRQHRQHILHAGHAAPGQPRHALLPRRQLAGAHGGDLPSWAKLTGAEVSSQVGWGRRITPPASKPSPPLLAHRPSAHVSRPACRWAVLRRQAAGSAGNSAQLPGWPLTPLSKSPPFAHIQLAAGLRCGQQVAQRLVVDLQHAAGKDNGDARADTQFNGAAAQGPQSGNARRAATRLNSRSLQDPPPPPPPPHPPDSDAAALPVGRLCRGDLEQRAQRAHRQAGVCPRAHHRVRLAAAGLAISQDAHVVTVGTGPGKPSAAAWGLEAGRTCNTRRAARVAVLQPSARRA